LRSALFWDITRLMVAFLTVFGDNLSDWSRNSVGCSETSLRDYLNTLCNIPRERSHIFRAEAWTHASFGALDFGFELDKLVYGCIRSCPVYSNFRLCVGSFRTWTNYSVTREEPVCGGWTKEERRIF
jgi:hypothetical protein